jgi:hypothetical protein
VTTEHAVVGMRELPRIYLACPLTNLTEHRKRTLKSEVSQVKMSIERLTVNDRVADEIWPVAVYAPIEHTAPWCGDGLSPVSIYMGNFSQVLDSDAVIVLADQAASAGVGQELEWAARIGIPVLYLSSSKRISRQIAGIPAAITCVAYNSDSDTLAAQIENFLRNNRTRIEDGPRRRASRRLRFEPLAAQLRQRWYTATDRTGIAARCLLSPILIDMTLEDTARVAFLSADSLSLLCAELAVALSPSTRQLSIPATRALILAAVTDAWPDDVVQRLRLHALAAAALDPDLDLATPDAWRRQHDDLGNGPSPSR